MWRLQLPVHKRIGLIAMFSLGLLYALAPSSYRRAFTNLRERVTLTSITRIVYVTRVGLDDTCRPLSPTRPPYLLRGSPTNPGGSG